MPATRNISALQFALLITAAYTAIGIFQFPQELLSIAGPDALYALLLEFLGGLGGLWLWFQVNHLDPNETVSGFSARFITPILAWPTLVFTVALHILLAVLVLTNFAFVMTTFFLPDTPRWAIQGAIALVAMYAAWSDTPALSRTIQTIYVPTFVLTLMMAGLLIPNLTDTYAWLPSSHLVLSRIGQAAYHGFYILWGYEVTVTLYPFVRSVDRARAERYALWAMVVTCFFYLIAYLFILGTEGPYLLMVAQWPAVSTMRLISASGFIIDKLGLFVILLWSSFVLSFVSVRLWCLAHDIMPALGLRSRASYRVALLVFTAVVAALGQSYPNVPSLTQFTQIWMIPAMTIYNFGLPPVMLLGAFIIHRIKRPRAVTT